ncbi:hypothetical protein E2562_014563 [Oryza meyeriana var. granulata]|uniref:Uncharacterized protein n=1 Tax=Oryza meyeriana var. granulata TaxID=110450 RepID=A0A6G1EK29_9ORYZ|nr:hypothetical protein E2562_014563 [Oryza meyeriana var. granulata]
MTLTTHFQKEELLILIPISLLSSTKMEMNMMGLELILMVFMWERGGSIQITSASPYIWSSW